MESPRPLSLGPNRLNGTTEQIIVMTMTSMRKKTLPFRDKATAQEDFLTINLAPYMKWNKPRESE